MEQWDSVLSQILSGSSPTSLPPPPILLCLSLNNLDEDTGGWFIKLGEGQKQRGSSEQTQKARAKVY